MKVISIGSSVAFYVLMVDSFMLDSFLWTWWVYDIAGVEVQSWLDLG
jgi:hypothetical protein